MDCRAFARLVEAEDSARAPDLRRAREHAESCADCRARFAVETAILRARPIGLPHGSRPSWPVRIAAAAATIMIAFVGLRLAESTRTVEPARPAAKDADRPAAAFESKDGAVAGRTIEGTITIETTRHTVGGKQVFYEQHAIERPSPPRLEETTRNEESVWKGW